MASVPNTNMACNDRECAVCYSETGPFRTLGCGHEFCGGCIKTWYLKGTGTGCPMCRRPIHFKGFAAVREEWDDEHWRHACAEAADEYRCSRIEEIFEMAKVFGPRWRRVIMGELMDDLKEIDKTVRFLMAEGYDAESIDYVLFETDEYFSDRNVGKFHWIDEPIKQLATRYPKMTKSGAKGTRRARAPDDQFETVTFLIQI
jgi:hypothetical protein